MPMGATACIVVTRLLPYYEETKHWQAQAWWMHDNIPGYSHMYFFPKLAAFNIAWHERPEKRIDSYIEPKGCLTKVGMENHHQEHQAEYAEFLRRLSAE